MTWSFLTSSRLYITDRIFDCCGGELLCELTLVLDREAVLVVEYDDTLLPCDGWEDCCETWDCSESCESIDRCDCDVCGRDVMTLGGDPVDVTATNAGCLMG